jgi:hypothetical protein
MAAVDALIQHGNIPLSSLEDESNALTPDILVQSLTITAARDEKAYLNAAGATFGLEYRNPTITFAFDGYLSNKTLGLANKHPGTAVTTLANFTVLTYGFDPNDGTMIFMDPNRTETNTEMAKTTFSVKQYPFVV